MKHFPIFCHFLSEPQKPESQRLIKFRLKTRVKVRHGSNTQVVLLKKIMVFITILLMFTLVIIFIVFIKTILHITLVRVLMVVNNGNMTR